jgi:hypothetical protein
VLGKWLLPYATAAVLAGLGLGTRWFESRVSRTDLSNAVGAVQTVAVAAQSTAYHGASLADAHADQLAAVWDHLVSIEAELAVYRDHGAVPPAKRGRLIELAKHFYAREYVLQLSTHANDPAEAARLALLAPWRPDL